MPFFLENSCIIIVNIIKGCSSCNLEILYWHMIENNVSIATLTVITSNYLDLLLKY